MNIRPATEADVRALAALARETFTTAFGDSMRRDDLEAHLGIHASESAFAAYLGRSTVLVADDSARLVGFIQYGPLGGGRYEIFRLYVHAGAQNNGLGGRLMSHALADPVVAAASAVVLGVWEENTDAIRFYERCGFEITGEREFVVASGARMDRDFEMTWRPGT